MNAVEPPYKIRVLNAENLPADVLDWIKLLKFHLADARQEVLREEGLDIDVEIEIVKGIGQRGRKGVIHPTSGEDPADARSAQPAQSLLLC